MLRSISFPEPPAIEITPTIDETSWNTLYININLRPCYFPSIFIVLIESHF